MSADRLTHTHTHTHTHIHQLMSYSWCPQQGTFQYIDTTYLIAYRYNIAYNLYVSAVVPVMSLSIRHSYEPRLLHICVLFIGVPQVAVLSPVLFPVCSVHSFRRAPEAGAVLSPVQCYSMSSSYSASRMVLFPVCSLQSSRNTQNSSLEPHVIPHLFCTQLQACPKEQS